MSVATTEAPVLHITFTEPGLNQDPYPVLEQIRAAGPVVYNEAIDKWMVTSYRNCAQVLGNARKFNSQGTAETFKAVFGGITMEALDDERHNKMRGIWAKQFQRDSLERHREMVTEVIDQRLVPFVERIRSGEVVEAVGAMTRGIPTLVIAHLLGIETAMYEQFSAWSDAMGATSEGQLERSERAKKLVDEGLVATASLNAYIAEQLPARRRSPGDDLISDMVTSEYARTGMSEVEIIASNSQLVFAGNETTAKLMAATLVALGQHPDQRQLLVEDRSLVPQAFEEVHRWQTLTQAIPRHACSEESVIDGVRIPNGAEVMPLQGAANRDPQRWDRAGEFDIRREHKQHLGFGFGMHSCIGLNLARMEATIWLNRVLDLMPDYSLAGEVDYGTNFLLRGPAAVPIGYGA